MRKSRAAIAGGLTLGLIVAAALWMFLPRSPPGPTTDATWPIVAVLPFENLTGNPSLDHVGLGTAHSLVSALSTLPGVTAISRAATQQYGADSTDVSELARSLGATFVVQGVVQAVAERLQITASVVRPDGSVVWGQSYEGVPDDLFDLQRRISRGVSEALRVTLRPADVQRLNEPATHDRDAYAEYSQGRGFLERPDVAGNLQRAARLFESAIGRDPSFALAHAGLAEARWEIYRDTSDQQWVELAMSSAEEARRLNPTSPEVRQALAVIYEGTGRYEEALLELDGALELQPRADEAHRLRGAILGRQGLVDEAADAIKTAIDIRPDFWRNHRELGMLRYRSGEFSEARVSFRRITELQPDLAWGHQMLGVSYHQEDMLDEAIPNYERAISIGASPASLSNLGVVYYRQGDYEAAANAFTESLELEEDAAGYRNLGDAYRRLARDDDAVAAYGRAIQIARDRLQVNPNSASLLGLLGLCLAKLGDHEEAVVHAERAVELEPRNGYALHKLAAVHLFADRPDDALNALVRAIDAGLSRSEAALDDDLIPLRDHPRFVELIRE